MVKARVATLQGKQRDTQRTVAGLDEELRALNARQSEAEQAQAVVETAAERWAKAAATEQKAMAKRVADALGGSFVVSLEGTLEEDLIGKIALARIAVGGKLRRGSQ